jgi:cytochrome c2
LSSPAVTRSPATARSPGSLVILQVLCAAAIASIASRYLHSPVWGLPPDTLLPIVLLGVSYLACASVLLWREPAIGAWPPGSLLLLLAAGYAPTLLILTLTKADLPRRSVLVGIGVGVALVCATSLLRRRWALHATVLGIAIAVGAAIQVPLAMKPAPTAASPTTLTWPLKSTLYPLRVTEYRNWFGEPKVEGGGMTPVGDRYLLATGDGDLYLVAEVRAEHALKVQRVPYKVPVNADEFSAAVGNEVDAATFRVADILVQELEGKTRLFATHYFWKAAEKCYVVRLSMLESTDSSFLTGSRPGLSWQTVFESSPCIAVDIPGQPPHFAGIQIGGRLALLSERELLVTLGDNELDGLNSPISAPQDPKSSYGKTLLIDLQDFSSRNFSIGHRNPEGLYADKSGAIWETEHGPQGGDELNLLQRGSNYGWPLETYGVEYGTHTWPFDAVPGTHDHFTEPYYSWTPSVGVSSLLVSNSPLFKLWSGDLLVSSLKDEAIYRMRIRDSRVVMPERIAIGERIRDINEGREGELLLWTDDASLLVIRIDTDVGLGETAFQACSGCHAIDWEHHGIGPDLFHVVNRKVGTAPNFKYSPAMRALGGKWTPERLDAFLKNPQGFVPGTSMRFAGVPDADTRAKLIAFLSSSVTHPVKQQLRP